MRLDFLSPAQWTTLLNVHRDMARPLSRGFLHCGNCQKREKLNATLVEKYLREGWPVCCPDTLAGGVMNYYASEANFKKEQQRGRA